MRASLGFGHTLQIQAMASQANARIIIASANKWFSIPAHD
jgi:hypothetical protein